MDTAVVASVLIAGAVATPALARVIKPDREKTREILCRTGVMLVSEEERSLLRRKLIEAGLYDMSADWFAGLRLALTGGFALLCIPLFLLGIDLFWAILFTPLIYFIPGMWLNSRVSRRKSQIRLALADFSVLFSTALTAGADIFRALKEAADSVGGPLGEEIGIAIKECQTNRSLVDALMAMADRTNVDELRNMVQAIVQSYRYGAHMAESMQRYGEQMRNTRRYEIMETASRLNVVIVIPVLVFMLFPSMVVLFYPAAVQLLKAFSS